MVPTTVTRSAAIASASAALALFSPAFAQSDGGRPADAAAAVAQAPRPVPPPPPPVVESPFNGVWRFVGGDAERRGLEASLARAVQGMGWPIEGIAVGRLRERNPIPDVITVRVANNVVEYTGLRGRQFRTPADGTQIQTTNVQGEPISLSTRVTGNIMVRVGARPDGSRREVVTVSGNTLIIDGTVSSPRLPRPLTYRLTYRR
jgi:hypothetical protein